KTKCICTTCRSRRPSIWCASTVGCVRANKTGLPVGRGLSRALLACSNGRRLDVRTCAQNWATESFMVARVLFPCTHSLEELDRLPTAGDHKGPPNLSSTTLAPTDRLASCLTSQLRLMRIRADQSAVCAINRHLRVVEGYWTSWRGPINRRCAR